MLFFVIFSNMVIVISDNFSPYSCFVLKNNMYLCRSTENIKY